MRRWKVSSRAKGAFIVAGILATLQATALALLLLPPGPNEFAEATPLFGLASIVFLGLPALIVTLMGVEWKRKDDGA